MMGPDHPDTQATIQAISGLEGWQGSTHLVTHCREPCADGVSFLAFPQEDNTTFTGGIRGRLAS